MLSWLLKCQSAWPHVFRLCCCVWKLCRAASPLRRKNIDFFPMDNKTWLTWVLAWLRLLPLSMVVCTNLRRTHQNSECLHATVDVCKKKRSKILLNSAAQCRLINCKVSNDKVHPISIKDERGKKKNLQKLGDKFQLQSVWALID